MDLGDRFDLPRTASLRRIVGLCAPPEVHDLGVLTVLELLRQDGGVVTAVSENQSAQGMREFVGRYAPYLVCLTCTATECVASATALIRDLKKPSAHVLVSYEQNTESPIVKDRGLSTVRTHAGIGQVRNVGAPAKLSLTPVVSLFGAPPLGWHGREIVEEVGYGDRSDELVNSGVVGGPEVN